MSLTDPPQGVVSEQDRKIGELKSAAERYARFLKGPAPQIGDIVTPRGGGRYEPGQFGEPHIVVETRDKPPLPDIDLTKRAFGQRLDIRVAFLSFGTVTLRWVESFDFKPWGEADDFRAAEPHRDEHFDISAEAVAPFKPE